MRLQALESSPILLYITSLATTSRCPLSIPLPLLGYAHEAVFPYGFPYLRPCRGGCGCRVQAGLCWPGRLRHCVGVCATVESLFGQAAIETAVAFLAASILFVFTVIGSASYGWHILVSAILSVVAAIFGMQQRGDMKNSN